MLERSDSLKIPLKLNNSVLNITLKELIAFMFSITTASEQEISTFLGSKYSESSKQRAGVLTRCKTYLNPGEYMNILMTRLTKVTSVFGIVFAEYSLQMTNASLQSGGQNREFTSNVGDPRINSSNGIGFKEAATATVAEVYNSLNEVNEDATPLIHAIRSIAATVGGDPAGVAAS